MGDDDDFIMDEFEWALKDPTEEKLRGLGEVVSTITKRLVDAIGIMEGNINSLQSQITGLESKISSLESKVARGVSPAAASDFGSSPADAASSIAKAPMAAAPKPVSAAGGGGMMGELKALLTARRKKAGSDSE